MSRSIARPGTAPHTLMKIILLLGLTLAAAAARAEPDPSAGAAADAGAATCAETTFEFGGRVFDQEGHATDTWTLTCWRRSPSVPETASAAPEPAVPEPAPHQPVELLSLPAGEGLPF